jgi:hypothetical protein
VHYSGNKLSSHWGKRRHRVISAAVWIFEIQQWREISKGIKLAENGNMHTTFAGLFDMLAGRISM